MSRPSENDSFRYQHTNSSTASLPSTPSTLKQFLPRPKPLDESHLDRIQFSPSPAASIETSSRGSTLYIRSISHPQPASSKDSPRTRNRRSRQSLSLIGNQASASLDDHDVAQKASQSLAREKMAWKVINREIAEWQNVCHTGRPSWWSPASRGTRRVRSQSSISRDMSTFGTRDSVDEEEYLYYPGLCFEFERRKDSAKDGQQPWLHELAYMIAVQLLSACFTLPVEQFSNCRKGIYLTHDIYGVPEMPDERLISSLRMHTNYRWSPAFGHEARTTSPETRRSASYGGHAPYTQHMTTPGGGVQSSPDVHDSSWRARKTMQHRVRHVTPAETEHQEYWEDTYEKAYGLESPLRTPTLGSWRDGSWRDRRNKARSASNIPVPGRVVQSPPPTPPRLYVPPIPSKYPASSPRDEYPFPITAAVDAAKKGRNSLHPHLRSDPHPVFEQPVRELLVKRWPTFRRRFGYSMSHGDPDHTVTTTNTTFTEERSAATWGPAFPASPALFSSPQGVKRRRNAHSRHMHSSSMESSPRYNTPTSGAHSRTPSGTLSPGLGCAPPQSTPITGEIDDLIAAARAITNSSSGISQQPLTAIQPFPVFTPNNTPYDAEEEQPSAGILRSETGYFTTFKDSTGSTGPNFVPKVNGSGKCRSNTRGSRRAGSRLSEVFTQDEVTEEEQKYQLIQAAKRCLFDVETHSTLTTPTEESDSDGSKSKLRRGSVVVMGDPPPTSILSPNLSDIVRLDSPSPYQRIGTAVTSSSATLLSLPTSSATSNPRPPSVASVDTDPFAFLSPRRDSPGSGSPNSPAPTRPHRPSLSSMFRIFRNESPVTQRRDSPYSPAIPDPWANRPSMSYTDRWTPPCVSPMSMSRDDSRSSPSTTYMSALYRHPSPNPTPPNADVMFSPTIRSPQPSYPRTHPFPPTLPPSSSRSSTASPPP